MIDWHSHILPQMDDGSKSVEESIEMLKALASQGVSEVIATPHFYANDETVESFLSRRRESYERLSQRLFEGAPRIRLGAEVAYYSGISRLPELRQLCIAESKCLLLEMPMAKWTEYTVKELEELAHRGKINLVLAHVDRYLSFQTPKIWERLCEGGCIMQVNANAVINHSKRRKILSLRRRQLLHCIGSDCHNVTVRPPHIAKAFEIAEKKLGDKFVDKMNELGSYLLG